MQFISEPPRDVAVVRQVDVLIVGGGPAGFVAATAAARLGVSALLVERYGCLGGMATGGLVLYMDGLSDGEGARLVGGLPWEVLERLRLNNGLAVDGPLRLHVDSELLQVEAQTMGLEAGAELRLHSLAVGAIREGRQVKGVVVESKSGRQAVLSRVTIDATGDGDVAAFAGASFEMGCQRIGLNLKVGGVDRDRFRAYERDHPERARALRAEVRALGGFPLRPSLTPYSNAGVYWINVLGLAGRDRTGQDEGTIHDTFAGELSAINVEDLTFAEVELRRRLVVSIDFTRENIPGFEDVRLLAFAPQLGVRESRRITGHHVLTREDVMGRRAFDDIVGVLGIGFADVEQVAVPYRCLVPRDVDGLLVAGRCISVDRWTQQAIRLIPPAMVTGEAAGTAAALAARAGISPGELDPADLREQLESAGAIL